MKAIAVWILTFFSSICYSQQWEYVAPLQVPRAEAVAVTLDDQRILVIGGYNSSGTLATCEIYDQLKNKWSYTGSMATGRHRFQAVRLSDGRIFVAGGLTTNGAETTDRTEIYDPANGTWRPGPNMSTARQNFISVLLPDGRVLLLGGINSNSPVEYLNSMDIYDPSTGTMSSMPPMLNNAYALSAYYHSGTNSMIVAGGLFGGTAGYYLRSTQLFSFASGSWSYQDSLAEPHANEYFQCAQLSDGDMLLLSGRTGQTTATKRVERFDFPTRKWSTDGYLATSHWQCKTFNIDDDSLLVVAGIQDPDVYNALILNTTWYDARTHTSWDGPRTNELRMRYAGTQNRLVPSAPCYSRRSIYIIGGERRGEAIASVEVLNFDRRIPVILDPQASLDTFLYIGSCDSSKSLLNIDNPSCLEFVVERLEILGDTKAYEIGKVSFPWAIESGASNNLPVKLNIGSPVGEDSLLITGYYETDTGRVYKTIKVPFRVSDDISTHGSLHVDIPNIQTKSSCDSGRSVISVINPSCREWEIVSITHAGEPFSIDTMGKLPLQLLPGASARLDVFFSSVDNPGAFEDSIHIQGYEMTNDGPRWFDTVVAVSALVPATPPSFILSAYSIDLPGISTCRSIDTAVSITNTGCDTLTITAAELVEAGFELEDMVMPVRLAPGESVVFRVIFAPDNFTKQFATLKLATLHQGLPKIVEIPLSGVGLEPEVAVAMSAGPIIFLPAITKCQSSDTLFTIQNKGCDTLKIEITQLSGTPVISVQSGSYRLPPDSLATTAVSIAPVVEGSLDADILIRILDKNGNLLRDSIIHVNNTILPGSKILSASLTALDLGTMSLCESKSKSFVLKNDGCDTLFLNSLELIGKFTTNTKLPIKLGPGESTMIMIDLSGDVLGTEKIVEGTLHVGSTADNELSDITLNATISEPRSVMLSIRSPKPEGSSMDEVWYDVLAEGGLSGVNAIDFDLTYNSDMLSKIVLTSGTVISSSDASPMNTATIHLSGPFSDAAVLETITFSVRFADQLNSPLLISNVKLNNGDPDFAKCVASVDATGSEFNYVDDCGDKYLRDTWIRMQQESLGGVIREGNMLRIEQAAVGEATLELYDVLGRELARVAISGHETARMSIDGVGTGAYVLRMVTPVTVKSRVIHIQR